jgi:hypothetical protein
MGLVHGLLLRITLPFPSRSPPLVKGIFFSGIKDLRRLSTLYRVGVRRRSVVLGGMKRDSVSSCSQEPAQFSSLGQLLVGPPFGDLPATGTGLVEPPTPTADHVRSILDLTKYPSYLSYALAAF